MGFGSRRNSNGPLRMFPFSSRSTMSRDEDGPCGDEVGVIVVAHFVVVVLDDMIKADAASKMKRVGNRRDEMIFMAVRSGSTDC